MKDAPVGDQPTFLTKRLVVRPFQQSDVPGYFRLYSDREVARSLGRVPHASLEETDAMLKRVLVPRSRSSHGNVSGH